MIDRVVEEEGKEEKEGKICSRIENKERKVKSSIIGKQEKVGN